MNTNIHKIHRHIVAGPLFTLALFGIVATTSGTVASAVFTATVSDRVIGMTGRDQQFTLEDGTFGRLSAEGSLDVKDGRAELLGGGALVASRGIVWLKTGDAALLGLRGGMYVHRSESTVTVAALSTPVLLRHQGFVAFVPQGGQATWKLTDLPATPDHARTLTLADAVGPIDGDFLRDQLQDLQTLSAGNEAEQGTTVTDRVLSAGTDLLGFLRLPAAARRLQTSDLTLAFDRIDQLLAENDAAGLKAFVSDDAVSQYLLSSPETARRLPGALRAAADRPALLDELYPFVSDPDLQLLSALHPALRSVAWASPVRAEDGGDTALLRVLLFPLSDSLPEAAAEPVVRHWGDALQAQLQAAEDPTAVVRDVFPAVNRFVAQSSRLGYPDRLSRLLDALSSAFSSSEGLLTDDERLLLASWSAATVPAQLEAAAGDAASSSSSSEASVASAQSSSADGSDLEDVLKAFGRGAPAPASGSLSSEDAKTLSEAVQEELVAAGALLTVQTKIEAVGADHVAVSQVVFSGPSGDHFYGFEYQPSAKTLTSITRDGAEQLFGMTLGDFLTWATK